MSLYRGHILDPSSQTWAKAAGLVYVTGEGPGITRKRHGQGFAYFDANAKPVRDQSALGRIRSLVIPPAWEAVWICPTERGHIQAIGRDARGRKQYRYHPRYREIRDQTKFERMVAFGAALPDIRRQVDNDLALSGLPKRKVVAAIVRLLDDTCIRVGNEEYAKANHSFGLTTLRDRHAAVNGDTIHLRFLGKSKQEHDISLRDRRLSRIVKKCQDLPGQDLFQYRSDDGAAVPVGSADVNEYLREVAREDFTAKDFRTWHGTHHIAAALAALGQADSNTEARRNVVAAVKQTAKLLGNRPAACRKYYVHPAIIESYLDRNISTLLTRVPAAQAVRGLRPHEKAVLRLIQCYERRETAKGASR